MPFHRTRNTDEPQIGDEVIVTIRARLHDQLDTATTDPQFIIEFQADRRRLLQFPANCLAVTMRKADSHGG